MTLPRRRLEEAAFWGFAVCLDCQGLFEPSAGLPPDEPPACPACSSSRLILAETILACADFIEEPEDE